MHTRKQRIEDAIVISADKNLPAVWLLTHPIRKIPGLTLAVAPLGQSVSGMNQNITRWHIQTRMHGVGIAKSNYTHGARWLFR